MRAGLHGSARLIGGVLLNNVCVKKCQALFLFSSDEKIGQNDPLSRFGIVALTLDALQPAPMLV